MAGPKRGSDLEIDMLSWFASDSVDQVADYAARGRRHSSLENDALFEAWKHAMRAMAAQPERPEHRALEKDLSAEIRLRGLEPPFGEVKEAIDSYTQSIADLLERLRQDPDELESINSEIVKDLEEFISKRDRGQ
jgi:hypothetical protein